MSHEAAGRYIAEATRSLDMARHELLVSDNPHYFALRRITDDLQELAAKIKSEGSNTHVEGSID